MLDQIIITTGARLHCGFFAHRPPAAPKTTGASQASAGNLLAHSNFGGIGMMIDAPAFVVAASKSDGDRVASLTMTRDDDAARTVSIVTRLVAQYRRTCPLDRQPPPCSIEVRRMIPFHSGLGSGTQLAMAVAQALALMAGDGQADAPSLARRVARGKRSAIGIHGFGRGGFLVDGGKRTENEIGRLVARADVPDEWRWLLVTPPDSSGTGLSGEEEVNALARLPEMPLSLTERLCRLTVLEMIPALGRSDCDWFGEALFQFGRSVGKYFRPVQGGQYADPRMADLVEWLRCSGIRGVAQTSWGPTIAICCANLESAESLKTQILADDRWKSCQVQAASPLNTGAAIQL
jgi:beta-ribofuranosylaminobenzene 5'-phosphate synthase